jgi:uncharacterized protein
MDLTLPALALVTTASMAAGVVNALAGGGTLLAFPALTLAGVPPVEASITTTTALTPGYLGGTIAQRTDLGGQRRRFLLLAPAGAVGGVAGALILTATSEELFRVVIPWLIFAACGLLAAQSRLRARLAARSRHRRARAGVTDPVTDAPSRVGPALVAVTGLGAVYGGYFGAGLGIILLAVLGLGLDDDLRRVNALKQSLSLAINVAAAGALVLSGRVPWDAAAVVAAGSLVGGAIGGRIAGRLDPDVLRRAVITLGLAVGAVYLVRSLT